MQNFITSSHRVIKTLEHKNEEIFEEISPTVNKRFWLQTILRKMNILEMV
jgi:alpha-mannosidase